MSERYGCCKRCSGQGSLGINECSLCGGTGFSGDAMDYVDPRYALRTERKRDIEPDSKKESTHEIAVQAFLSSNKRKWRIPNE
jgi:hypothetical protein